MNRLENVTAQTIVGFLLLIGIVGVLVAAVVVAKDIYLEFGGSACTSSPKIVDNKIDVLCLGQSVTVWIGGDGTLAIVESKQGK